MLRKFLLFLFSTFTFTMFINSQNIFPYSIENRLTAFTVDESKLTVRETSSGDRTIIEGRKPNFAAFLFLEGKDFWMNQYFKKLNEDEIYFIEYLERGVFLFRYRQSVFKVIDYQSQVLELDVSKFERLGDFLYKDKDGQLLLLTVGDIFSQPEVLSLGKIDSQDIEDVETTSFHPLLYGYYVDDYNLYHIKDGVLKTLRHSDEKVKSGVLSYDTFYYNHRVFTYSMIYSQMGETLVDDIDLEKAQFYPINNIGDDILTDGKIVYKRNYNSSNFIRPKSTKTESTGEPKIQLTEPMMQYLTKKLNIQSENLKSIGCDIFRGQGYLIHNSMDTKDNIVPIDEESFCMINPKTFIDKDNIYTLSGLRHINIIPRTKSNIDIKLVKTSK